MDDEVVIPGAAEAEKKEAEQPKGVRRRRRLTIVSH